ncbi:8495_t:CDS:2 [Paraglomus occultum]|uniref:holo-[acyl-carrier-protein] synthase n=1 Tax=Paraglomus occultum TaxID=144539 RepID=A0A9N9AHJ8_9GLOM|nr:8495_t:CDS:2 [Paraglomus occultum]
METSLPKITALWAVNIITWNPTDEEFDDALSTISAYERERICQLRIKEQAKASLIGRLLLLYLFNSIYNIQWEAIKFERTKENKPILASSVRLFIVLAGLSRTSSWYLTLLFLLSNQVFPDIGVRVDFNVSHHGDWVVLVASENCRVGIDVMKIEEPYNENIETFLESLREQLSKTEWDAISAPDYPILKLHRFYRYWCLKESYIKAIGVGLAMSLKKLDFHIDESEGHEYGACNPVKTKTRLFVCGTFMAEWHFRELYLDELHCIAIAYETNNDCINHREFDSATIINIKDVLKKAVKVC